MGRPATVPDEQGNSMPELPDYEVRVSRRARHARVSVSYLGRVAVIIPERFPRSRVPQIVVANTGWIERARERFAAEGARLVDCRDMARPVTLQLRLVREELDVVYEGTTGTSRTRTRDGSLYVSARDGDEDGFRQALKRYLSRRARVELEPRLIAIARALDIDVPRVAIRAQQTRWGSCSPSGTISLNSALLFLPEPLVRYVFLHELCHRRELNHSQRFWSLLHGLEPDSERLRNDIKGAWNFIPAWLGAANEPRPPAS